MIVTLCSVAPKPFFEVSAVIGTTELSGARQYPYVQLEELNIMHTEMSPLCLLKVL